MSGPNCFTPFPGGTILHFPSAALTSHPRSRGHEDLTGAEPGSDVLTGFIPMWPGCSALFFIWLSSYPVPAMGLRAAACPGRSFGLWAVPALPAASPTLPFLSSSPSGAAGLLDAALCVPRFCGECLQPCLQVPSPLCPLCRMPFDPKKVEKASSVEKQLASYKAPCRGCSKKVKLAGVRWLSPSHAGTASFGCQSRSCSHLLSVVRFVGSPV